MHTHDSTPSWPHLRSQLHQNSSPHSTAFCEGLNHRTVPHHTAAYLHTADRRCPPPPHITTPHLGQKSAKLVQFLFQRGVLLLHLGHGIPDAPDSGGRPRANHDAARPPRRHHSALHAASARAVARDNGAGGAQCSVRNDPGGVQANNNTALVVSAPTPPPHLLSTHPTKPPRELSILVWF